MFRASENVNVSHADISWLAEPKRGSEPAFALRASARQPSLASPQAWRMACGAVARERARLRPLGLGAAAFARFAPGQENGLPSRSSRSERRLVGEVGLEP